MENIRESLEELTLDGVEEIEEIDRGSYGVVKICTYKKLRCAGKNLHELLRKADQRAGKGGRNTENFVRECKLLSKQRHPNIVLFLGVYFQPNKKYPSLLMEYLPRCLDDTLLMYQNIPGTIKNRILYDVACGLHYLHSQDPPLVHRDLSSRNVLLSESLQAKIADFGVARIISDHVMELTEMPGTPFFMPPEARGKNPKYDKSLDMFSFGNIILITINQKWPSPLGESSLNEAQCRRKLLDEMGKDHPLRAFAEQCLENKPHKRPQASDAVEKLQEMTDSDESFYSDHLEALARITKISIEAEELKEKIQKPKDRETSPEYNDEQKKVLLDPAASLEWELCNHLPHPRKHLQATEFGGKVYIGSGYGITNDIAHYLYCYDPIENKWGDCPESKTRHFAMTVFDEVLLLIGGKLREDGKVTNKIQHLTDGNEWEFYDIDVMRTINKARAGAVAASIAFSIVLAGGYDDSRYRIDSVEVYNKQLNMWLRVSNLPQPCAEMKTALINGDRWYLLGGSNQYKKVFATSLKHLSKSARPLSPSDYENGGGVHLQIEEESWTSLADAKYEMSSTTILGGNLVAFGGGRESGFQSAVFVYNNFKKAWFPIGDMPIALSRSTAITLTSGELLIFGGKNKDGQDLDVVYKCCLSIS